MELTRDLIVTLVLTLAVSLVPPAEATQNDPAGDGKRYALLVGTGVYDEWAQLVNPVPDVRALGEVLRQRYGFLTERLENPTRTEILGKLRRYVGRDYGPNDQVLIVFAGHGTYDEVTEIGFLAARDSASRTRDPNFATLIGYPMLLTLIDRIPSPQILLAVDACYSGSLGAFGTGGATDGALRVRRYLTSGGTEYTPDGDPDRHSPFMAGLLSALDRPGDGRVVSFDEMGAALSGIDPTPRWGSFGRDGGGELRLVAGPSGFPAASTTASASPTRSVARPTGPPPAPPAPTPVRPRLRAEPARVSENDLERAFRRLELYEASWDLESNFPNELRRQTSDGWDVVLDLESGLMWQQAGSAYRLSPGEAREYVTRLNQERHAGFADWRLPTLEELGSLVESFPQPGGLFLDSAFDPEQETCWSSDLERQAKDGYYVSFATGRVVLAYGGRKAFVRAVRSQ